MTWYAYFCVHKLHWAPTQFLTMNPNERACVIAFIDQRVEDEKREKAKMRTRSGGRRRRR